MLISQKIACLLKMHLDKITIFKYLKAYHVDGGVLKDCQSWQTF